MKHLTIIVCAMFIAVGLYGQSDDPIIGKWQNPSGEGRIEIFLNRGIRFLESCIGLRTPIKKMRKIRIKSCKTEEFRGSKF